MTEKELQAIVERAEEYQQCLNIAKFHDSQNASLRAAGGFPSQNMYVEKSKQLYAEDVPRLLREIEQLKEQLKDREADLNFEHDSRIEAEQQLDDLKDRLNTCESELRFEQFLRHVATEAR